VFADGVVRNLQIYATPLFDSQGNVTGGVATVVDVSTYRSLEENLRQKADQLLEADRKKDEFLATLAHELRNPLAPIGNAVELLRMAGSATPQARQVQAMMERQVKHLARLVDDLMDVSRITRDKIELRRERLDLATVVQSAVETSRPLIESGNHDLTVQLPPGGLQVVGDATRLAQVLANLLNNSAKYTPDGGRIRLTVEQQGDQATIRVRDNGEGIPATMLVRVFDMFTQVERKVDRAKGGLGLGLTLVKRLVEMHGGSVEACSEGPGRGSEFTVRLPLAPAEPTATGEKTIGGAEARRRAPLRILVVDDNHDSAESLGMLLRLLGDDIRVVHNGKAALDTVREWRPEVMLLDIGMPGMSGYEVARQIRRMPELRGKSKTTVCRKRPGLTTTW
jgi:signal transduction histidine kinase